MAVPRATSNTKTELEGELPGPKMGDEEFCLAIRFIKDIPELSFADVANGLRVAAVPITRNQVTRGCVFFGEASQLRLVKKRFDSVLDLAQDMCRWGRTPDYSYKVMKSYRAFDFGVPMLQLD
jgi:hypothetical protein